MTTSLHSSLPGRRAGHDRPARARGLACCLAWVCAGGAVAQQAVDAPAPMTEAATPVTPGLENTAPLNPLRGALQTPLKPLALTYGVDVSPGSGVAQRSVLGASFATTRHTSVFYEQTQSVATLNAGPNAEPTERRVGLELKPVSLSKQLKDLGTLRFQFGTSDRLTLKPRSGGVTVSWRRQF